MATAKRQTPIALAQAALPEAATRDEFFHLVRLLERLYSHMAAGSSKQTAVGGDAMPDAEPVRFRVGHQAGFAARAIERAQPRVDTDGKAGPAYEVAVNFLGLTGPSGVLPAHYTRLVGERIKQHDRALADFLDLFNHRLISLYYRAWAKYRLPIQFEAHQARRERDPITQALQSLSGQTHRRYHEPRLYFSGHFARHTRSAAALQAMLQDCLRHRVVIEPFQGHWLPIRQSDRARIGTGANGCNNRFGHGILLGKHIWDAQSRCHIVIGPVTHAQHRGLIPGSRQFALISELIHAYVPVHVDVVLVLHVEDDSEQRESLGQRMQFGVNTWLATRRHHRRYSKIHLRPFARDET